MSRTELRLQGVIWVAFLLIGALTLFTACSNQEKGQSQKAQTAGKTAAKARAPEGTEAKTSAPMTPAKAKENEMQRINEMTKLALKERPALKTAPSRQPIDLRRNLRPQIAPMTPKAGSSQAMKVSGSETNQQIAKIQTRFGDIYIEFYPDVAPKTVANFKKLARSGFYNGTTFHRVIPRFVIQGGDPNSKDDDRSNDGMGGPGWTVPAEFNNIKHERGVVSMARSSDPNSAGSQFFICLGRLPSLDHKYTAFGRVIKGMDVVDKIAAVKTDARDNPIDRVEMKVTLLERKVVGPSGQ